MTAATRDTAGRFAKATPPPCCTECGSMLAENLRGDLKCLTRWCDHHGHVVGNSGADVGVLGVRAAALTATPTHGKDVT